MLKPKFTVRYEKRGLADINTKKIYRQILKDILTAVLNSSCAKNIVYSCNESGLKGLEVNFIFTDDESICEINSDFRNINKSTDVLSFPINDFAYGNGEIDILNADSDTGRLLLGDIIISVPTMKKQALEYGHSVERECAFLACHGMLHLLGFDHMNDKDEKQMFGYADDILNTVGYTRN